MKFRNLVLGSSLSALGLGFTVSALAQGIEEVIVTAQKREESAQDIPIAIDVITGDTFIKEGVRDIKDMNKMSTELEMNFNAGQATTIGIRGMQQPGFSPNADTLAAVHVDGAYISSFWSLNGLMFDLARAEVLSGPQGTLYGRNSAAGAVNLITKRPGDNFEGNVSVDVGNYDSQRIEGGVTIPLGDTLSIRAAGMNWTRDPLFTNGGADVDQSAGRLSLNWNLTDNDTVFATYDYSDFRGYVESGNTLLGIANVPNYNIATSTLNTVQPVPTSIQGLVVPSDPYDNLAYERDRRQLGYFKAEENWNRTYGVMAQWDHDFGSFGSTLQYAYRRNKDVAYSNPTYPLANFAATQALPNTFTNDIESTTVEFRLTSSGDSSLKWVTGLFYFDGKALGDNATPVNANAASRVLATGRIVPQVRALNQETNLNTIGYPFQNAFGPNSGTTESWAVFAQGTWTPESLDRWHFTAGARYSADKKTALLGTWVNGTLASLVYDPSKYASIAALPSYVAPYVVTSAEATLTNPATFVQPIGNDSWGSVQWRVGVDFDLTDTSLLYGSIATGYKSGGFSYGSTPRIEPEDLLAFEIGTKNRLLDNTLQLNASAWYYIYENLEATATRALAGNAVVCNGTPTFDGSGNLIGCSTPIVTSTGSVANVAEAKVAGVSFDTDWLVTDADRVGVSATWTYSKIVDGHENYLGVRRLVANEGERIGDAPEFVWLARYAHTFSFSNGASLEPQLKYQWQSEKWDRSSIPAGSYIAPVTDIPATAINLVATPTNPLVYNLAHMNPKETAIPSRGILDFSMRYSAPSGNWDLTGYVNNLTDELNIRGRNFGNNPTSSGATGNYGHITGTLGEPRMWGIILNARF